MTSPKIDLSRKEFDDIRELIYDAFGISLADHKQSLVRSRLQKFLVSEGYSSYRDYIDDLKHSGSEEALALLANRISTNYTYFYRESPHFDFMLTEALPQICDRLRQVETRDLRIWCAGCATGEEAYTLQILTMEHLRHEYKQWQAGVLATDISTKALRFALQGVYAGESVKKLPAQLVKGYFKPIGEDYKVADAARNEVMFRRFNLMTKKFPFKGKFHIIFCRNVMIYFDKETRYELVERYSDHLEEGGFLFIGHSESLGRDHDRLKYVMPAVYQRI